MMTKEETKAMIDKMFPFHSEKDRKKCFKMTWRKMRSINREEQYQRKMDRIRIEYWAWVHKMISKLKEHEEE